VRKLISILLVFFLPLYVCAQQADSAQQKFLESILDSYSQTKLDTLGRSYSVIQIAASFRGGLQGWTDYLSKNLNADLGAKYIKVKKGDTIARQTIIVTFTVQPTGIVSDVTAEAPEKGMAIHPKLAAEAIRVIAEGPRWEPAQQESFEIINGKIPVDEILAKKKKGFKKVLYRHKQSITFVVSVR
jgi:hypothetical protein